MQHKAKNSPLIAPFRGIRYNLEKVDPCLVSSPPYDVISPSRQAALYERDPHNVVRLDLGKQFAADTEGENRYTRSASTLERWLREGILIQDPDPSFYFYEQSFDLGADPENRKKFVRRGFIALRRLEDFSPGQGIIRPHEKTLSAPKEDRLLLMKATGANLSPIFCLYEDPNHALRTILDPYFPKTPLFDFTDEEGVGHRLWRAVDRDLFRRTDALLGRQPLLIADGHHRYETALNYKNWIQSRDPAIGHDHPVNFVMTFFADYSDPGLVILPTHRILKNCRINPADFKSRLKPFFEFTSFNTRDTRTFLKALRDLEGRETAFGLLLPGPPHTELMTLSAEGKKACHSLIPEPLQQIDTAILHRLVFEHLLGLDDREMKERRCLEFVKEAEEVFPTAGSKDFNAGFLLNAPTLEAVRKVAESGLVLPQKTTFFYPKVLTGLVLNQLHPAISAAM